jgi:hypothetical protein
LVSQENGTFDSVNSDAVSMKTSEGVVLRRWRRSISVIPIRPSSALTLAQQVASKHRTLPLACESSEWVNGAAAEADQGQHTPSTESPTDVLKQSFFQSFLTMRQDQSPFAEELQMDFGQTISWSVFQWVRKYSLHLSYNSYMALVRRLLERNDIERALTVVEAVPEQLHDLEVYKVWILLHVRYAFNLDLQTNNARAASDRRIWTRQRSCSSPTRLRKRQHARRRV